MKSRWILRPALFLLLAAIVSYLAFSPAAPAPAHAESALRVVRVGVVRPALPQEAADALIEQQTDYLGELSKHTGWDFAIIPVAPDDAVDALVTGKFDLLLPVEPHIEDTARFTATRPLPLRDLIGLYRRPDDDRYGPGENAADIAALDGARVAVNAAREDLLPPFYRFCRENGIRMTLVPCATDARVHAALADGTADVVLDAATSCVMGERLALAFDSMPMCIAGLREKESLIQSINEASDALDTESPLHRDHVKSEFETATRRLVTHFTPAEQALIERLPPLRVVLAQDDPSLEASREILQVLCDQTGLSATFLTVSTVQEGREKLKSGAADLMPDLYTRSSRAADFYFTDPLYDEAYILVGRSDASAPRVGTLALPVLQPAFVDAVQQKFPGWTIAAMPDEQHALAAVSNGRADLALSSVISMQATRNLMLYPNLVLVPSLSEITIGTSLAIARHEPRLLQSIFNKAMLRLDPQQKEQILLKHETRTPPHFSLSYFLTFYPLQTGLLLGMILLLSALGFFLRELLDRRRREAEERAALENYKYQSETDPLTGLYNKAALRQLIEHYLLEPPAPGHCHAFFICDLDHFKAANDLCGHSFGDVILISFAESLRTIVRSHDLIGRFGGDEFVLFLKNGTMAALPRIAGNINRAATLIDERERVKNPDVRKHPERPLITVSIGVAVTTDTSETYDEIFHKADQALYAVKEHGRDGWRVYEEGMEEA